MIDYRELETWFKGRHLWLQDAARRLLYNGDLLGKDIAQLTILCKSEAGMQQEDGSKHEAIGIPDGALAHREETIELKLNAISNLQGINSLAPRNPLQFGENNLTIIYGRNGSGKSGYVRALKHACGAKHMGEILANVFKEVPESQGCKFLYTINGQSKEASWMVSDGIHPELSTIEIYDSFCADVYVTEENEVAYEPGVLGFLQALVEVSDSIAGEIDTEIKKCVSKKPIIPPHFVNTAAGNWYEKLSYKTSANEINQWCAWAEEDKTALSQLKARLDEPNPKDRAATLRKQKSQLLVQAAQLQNIADALSPENCKTYLDARIDAQIKRKTSAEDAKKVFASAPVAGIGSETWRLLWEQARLFSETEAYKGIPFPNVSEDANCILCHQPINETIKERLLSFERFVRSGLEKSAEEAERRLDDLQKNLGDVPTEENILLRLDSCGLTEESERQIILDFRSSLDRRKASLLKADDVKEFEVSLDKSVIDFLKNRADLCEKQAIEFDRQAEKDNRLEIQKQLTEREARKWLSEQRSSIEAEITRLNDVHKLEEAKRLTNTAALSRKKSDLADELITQAYIERFNDEMKVLEASYINVTIEKTRTAKGRVFHQIRLKNNKSDVPTGEVLSEGELRIVSLAAFLADIEGRRDKRPIIFDDPISSLDQDFEEYTVERLVELCKNRQVIVFTHRLSLLALLEDAAEKASLEPQVISLEREAWGCGEPGEPPLPAQKPIKAINTMIERVGKARKVMNEVGKAEYDMLAQSICSDFRKTLERLIEFDLLSDVVQRFRRDIQTKNKIYKLAFISTDDCKLLDELMTEYSKYEHSQPRETPVSLPNPDQLQADLEKLKEWREDFDKRKKET